MRILQVFNKRVVLRYKSLLCIRSKNFIDLSELL